MSVELTDDDARSLIEFLKFTLNQKTDFSGSFEQRARALLFALGEPVQPDLIAIDNYLAKLDEEPCGFDERVETLAAYLRDMTRWHRYYAKNTRLATDEEKWQDSPNLEQIAGRAKRIDARQIAIDTARHLDYKPIAAFRVQRKASRNEELGIRLAKINESDSVHPDKRLDKWLVGAGCEWYTDADFRKEFDVLGSANPDQVADIEI